MAKKNFTSTTVATAPSPATTGTSLVVATGKGSLFAINEPAIIFPANDQPLTSNAEIVKVSNVVGDTLTIVRGQESTTARSIVAGDIIIQGITAKDWNDLVASKFTWRGAWATTTAYAVNDTVQQGGSGYVCVTAHTSGTFATDLSAGKWNLLVEGLPTPNLTTSTTTNLTGVITGNGSVISSKTNPAGAFVGTTDTQTLTNKTVQLTAAPGSDHTASGTTILLTAHANVAFGDVCFINADGEAALIDADAIASMSAVVMAVATISANASGEFLLLGIARDDSWAWTVGGLIYGTVTGTSGNTLSQTAPTGTDDVVQIMGVATHADRMYFNPQLVQIERT